MPLLDAIATYLASTGVNLGLEMGSTGNLFKVPLPESAPDAAVGLIEYPGRESVRAMGASLSSPVFERPKFQVTVRDTHENFETARTLATSIYNNLDGLADTTLSGTRYAYVRAIQTPFLMGPGEGKAEDSNERPRFLCNYEVEKERG
jgi:hypothetical protein